MRSLSRSVLSLLAVAVAVAVVPVTPAMAALPTPPANVRYNDVRIEGIGTLRNPVVEEQIA